MLVALVFVCIFLLSALYQFNVRGRVGRFLFRWDHFRIISGYRFFETVDVHYLVNYRSYADGGWTDWTSLDTCCRADDRWPGLLHEICNLIYLDKESGDSKKAESLPEEALRRYFRSYPGPRWEHREFQVFVRSKESNDLLEQGAVRYES